MTSLLQRIELSQTLIIKVLNETIKIESMYNFINIHLWISLIENMNEKENFLEREFEGVRTK